MTSNQSPDEQPSDNNLEAIFQSLWADIMQGETFPNKRPLLAHYTSLSTLENIMRSGEIWFSNPLYMNDFEELNFGMIEGAKAFRESSEIKNACSEKTYYDKLLNIFDEMFNRYVREHVFDTYIFCSSEHKSDNEDGLLSMWRGYGGNGHGAAIVFDSRQFEHIYGAPLVISKVRYASNNERRSWIKAKMTEFANLLLTANVSPEKLSIPIHLLFERIKMFALFTKHDGFSEEAEWRIAYLKERDLQKKFEPMFSYAVGRNGVEPKLKFKIAPVEGYTSEDLNLEKIVNKIILGPMMASPLAVKSVRRMLQTLKRPELAERVTASSTPFRPQ